MNTSLSRVKGGAGIIVYTVVDGEHIFLCGEQRFTGQWSDLGGRWDSKDRTQLDVAAREFQEESLGVFFPTLDHCKEYIREFTVCSVGIYMYRCFFVWMPYRMLVAGIGLFRFRAQQTHNHHEFLEITNLGLFQITHFNYFLQWKLEVVKTRTKRLVSIIRSARQAGIL